MSVASATETRDNRELSDVLVDKAPTISMRTVEEVHQSISSLRLENDRLVLEITVGDATKSYVQPLDYSKSTPEQKKRFPTLYAIACYHTINNGFNEDMRTAILQALECLKGCYDATERKALDAREEKRRKEELAEAAIWNSAYS